VQDHIVQAASQMGDVLVRSGQKKAEAKSLSTEGDFQSASTPLHAAGFVINVLDGIPAANGTSASATVDYPTLMTRAVALSALLREQSAAAGIRVVCSPAAFASAGFDVASALEQFGTDYDAGAPLLAVLPNTNLAYSVIPGTLSEANGGVNPLQALEGMVRCPYDTCVVLSISVQQMLWLRSAEQLLSIATDSKVALSSVNKDISTPSDWTDLQIVAFQQRKGWNTAKLRKKKGGGQLRKLLQCMGGHHRRSLPKACQPAGICANRAATIYFGGVRALKNRGAPY
jgi:hypothetical protein